MYNINTILDIVRSVCRNYYLRLKNKSAFLVVPRSKVAQIVNQLIASNISFQKRSLGNDDVLKFSL